jgi:hypothetical protein
VRHERLLVENILQHPTEFKWSVQGLGMMRIYLSKAVRLHIWDSALKIPGVSALHTHPWDLRSTVVAGIYRQYRYVAKDPAAIKLTPNYNFARIQCGEKACVMEEAKPVFLQEGEPEAYYQGESYQQTKDEIHYSFPEDGTVTLVERTFYADTEFANVYWRGKGGWVDAKPRAATFEEVRDVTQRSLALWFS